ncbi:sugar transferase [Ruminococcus bicirculans (ex Wegman et al. 2014)]
MKKSKKFALLTGAVVGATAIAAHVMKKKAEKTTYEADLIEPIEKRKMGFYEKYGKRILDIACATAAIVVFSPLYLGVAALVKLKLGSPVLFTQDRPGLIGKDGKETVFKMYKFRTMTDERDENGELLPDDVRLTKFGKWLRNTSLDELPEAFNILNGTMSVIGPRPQLVRDMTFMTKEQRARHTAKPGLSGLAQVNGRNGISWEEKLEWDRKYIQNVSFAGDVKIIFDTVKKAFIKQEGITQDDMATAEDFGDYLLRTGKIDVDTYRENQAKARGILGGKSIDKKDSSRIEKVEQSAKSQKYSVLMSLYKKEKPEYLRLAIDSMLNQTVPPDEIVMVEDGPLTDELYAVLDEYPMLHKVKNETNLGLGISLQKGLLATKNDVVARMDTDDIAGISRCEKQLEFLNNNPDISVVGGQIEEFIGSPDHIVAKRIVPLKDIELKEFNKKRCPFNHMTVMFKKKDIIEAGSYQDWFWNEDYYLWIRLALAGKKFANLPDVLVLVRTGEDMYQRRGGIKYFQSEAKLQKFMLDNNIINKPRYLINISERLVLQVLMPNKLRGWIFRTFARN